MKFRATQDPKWPNLWTAERRTLFGWKYVVSGTKQEMHETLDRCVNQQVIYPSAGEKPQVVGAATGTPGGDDILV